MKSSEALMADAAIGLTSGLVATGLTGPIQNLLYRLTPESVKRRDEQVRPGSPTEVAATNLAGALDARLDDRQIGTAATAIHYGSARPGAPYTPSCGGKAG